MFFVHDLIIFHSPPKKKGTRIPSPFNVPFLGDTLVLFFSYGFHDLHAGIITICNLLLKKWIVVPGISWDFATRRAYLLTTTEPQLIKTVVRMERMVFGWGCMWNNMKALNDKLKSKIWPGISGKTNSPQQIPRRPTTIFSGCVEGNQRGNWEPWKKILS